MATASGVPSGWNPGHPNADTTSNGYEAHGTNQANPVYATYNPTPQLAAPQQPQYAQAPVSPSAMIICPYCQQRGYVTTAMKKRKAGVSGGKATGAILTGGLSLLATGLSRKEWVTELYCGACRIAWTA